MLNTIGTVTDLGGRLLRRSILSVFQRPVDVGGMKTASLGRGQVARMRGDHYAFTRREIESFAGREIDFRLRLEIAGDFRTEYRVPRQVIPPRERDHQRDIA